VRGLRIGALLFLLVVLATGCHRQAGPRPIGRFPAPPPPRVAVPPPASGSYVEEGYASWYGEPYHGRRAANGEIYNMYDFTAAHRTLPFDTYLRVTNLENGKRAEVRINDRGPFVENRILDLSLAAARAIDMVGPGVARVRLEVIAEGREVPGGVRYGVQVGAFQERENAGRLKLSLETRYRPVIIVPYDSPRGLFYRVRVGSLSTESEARSLADRLAAKGFTPFVVRLD